MKKLLSLIVVAMFASVSASAFAASHAGAPMKDEKKMGPSLHGLYKKAKLTNGKKPTDATVKEIINKGGNGMPAYEDLLTDEERTNLLAYLKTL